MLSLYLTPVVATAAADVHTEDGVPPSMEMLLYLAEFEDSQGEWVDPMSVAATSDVPNSGTDGAASNASTTPEQVPTMLLDEPVSDDSANREPPR